MNPEQGPPVQDEPATESLSLGILGKLGNFLAGLVRDVLSKTKVDTNVSLSDGKGFNLTVNVTVLTASPVMLGQGVPREEKGTETAPPAVPQPTGDEGVTSAGC